ncbi:MAG TPA: MupA/Atu3671 family FMN-dependent luciferase-like monooxygenase, partial [Micromonosporaceae bacterium]
MADQTRYHGCATTLRSRADAVAALDLGSFVDELAAGRPVWRPGERPWAADEVARYLSCLDATFGAGPDVGALVVTEPPASVPDTLDIIWFLAAGRPVHLAFHQVPPWLPSAERGAKAVRLSLSYFANDEDDVDGPKYRLLLEGARLADRLGLAAIWTPERHFHAFGGLYPNPSVTSAAIAAVTSRIGIRAGSVVLPLHDPIRAAEEWAVIDNLSQGRVGISFASGWHANDFVLAPEQYPRRKQEMLDRISVVRRLWRGESVPRRNGAGDEVKVAIRPRPVQAELPFWLTAAGSPDTFRLAGELGAYVLTNLMGQRLEDLVANIARYREAWRAAGHEPGSTGHVTLMLHAFLADEQEQAYQIAREPLLRYFRSSVDISRGFAASQGLDVRPEDLSEHDLRALLEHGLERYLHEGGLFGTPASCAGILSRLQQIGVDEIAALIDFGVPLDACLRGIALLGDLSEREQARAVNAANSDAQTVERELEPLATWLRTHDVTAIRAGSHLLAWLDDFAPGLTSNIIRLGEDLVRHQLADDTCITAWAAPDGGALIACPVPGVEVVDVRGRRLGTGLVGDLVVPGRPPTGQRARWRPDGRLDLLPATAARRHPPLSFSQQRLWSLDHLTPDSIAYNNPVALHLRGRLDVASLHRALREVVRRHEILRTTFAATPEGAVQIIHPVADVELPVMEASADEVTRLAREHARQPFDLRQGPLLRARLLRL